MTTNNNWHTIQKFLFRFFFVYFIFYAAPWTWPSAIPLYDYVVNGYNQVIDWMVNSANTYLFKTYKELVPVNGSGDTSWAWTQLKLFILLSLLVAVIWSLTDRQKANYNRWNYALCQVLRYFLAINAFGYGIIKIFALQMYPPNLSQLATPLGEFLPMRFSWLFIGYSTPYQVFSGVMELLAGILLLNRKTVTAGVLLCLAVFTNVMVLNLSYDIPVKLFSTHLVIMSLYLAVPEYNRISTFFFSNQPAPPSTLYQVTFTKKWQRITRYILKAGFVVMMVGMGFYQSFQQYQEVHRIEKPGPIRTGVYDVAVFALNKDTIPPIIGDSARRWSNLIFDVSNSGSMLSADTLFRKRYGRAYFGYFPDTANQTVTFRWGGQSSDSLFTLRYGITDSITVRLWGAIRKDSVYVELKRTPKQFRLAEKQFHWLSEYNR